PLEAVADADHIDAGERAPDGGAADHAVDARRGAAADEDRELLSLAHVPSLFPNGVRINPGGAGVGTAQPLTRRMAISADARGREAQDGGPRVPDGVGRDGTGRPDRLLTATRARMKT